MKHEILADGIEIYQGDCLEVLPLLNETTIDTVITDPVWPNVPDGMFPDIEDPQKLLADALNLIDARRLVIILRNDSDPRFLSAVPEKWKYFRAQIMSYTIPGYIGRKLGGDEIAYSFGEPIPVSPGRRVIPGWGPKVQPSKAYGNNGHPCSRSPDHLRWLVSWWSLPGELIVDPFMGSATTAEACIRLGRRFIGIEIDENYYEIGKENIKRTLMQPNLL